MANVVIANPCIDAFEAELAEGVHGFVQDSELMFLLRLEGRTAWLVEAEARRRGMSCFEAVRQLLAERLEQDYGPDPYGGA